MKEVFKIIQDVLNSNKYLIFCERFVGVLLLFSGEIRLATRNNDLNRPGQLIFRRLTSGTRRKKAAFKAQSRQIPIQRPWKPHELESLQITDNKRVAMKRAYPASD